VLCTEVASRLRSGAGVAEAWRAALGSPVAGGPGDGRPPGAAHGLGRATRANDGGPGDVTGDETGDVTGDGVPRELLARTGSSPAADAVVVACRLAHRCGTPLAEILDECAHGITEVEAADADRRRALAGPAATARLLVWLPVASLGIGVGMGADPVGAVLAGGPAAPAMAAGTVCLLLGRWWIRRLVRSAERAGRGWGR
jgi:tight adherence protein B